MKIPFEVLCTFDWHMLQKLNLKECNFCCSMSKLVLTNNAPDRMPKIFTTTRMERGGGDGVSRALFLKHSVLHFHQELHKGHCDILLGM